MMNKMHCTYQTVHRPEFVESFSPGTATLTCERPQIRRSKRAKLVIVRAKSSEDAEKPDPGTSSIQPVTIFADSCVAFFMV